ncbi:MAG: branched-chain amino acid ABC transporter substrate-binding protein [Chloroflexi bacterium]|nr:branched-chain amino acid ABC transporter substrate-binding protein [Chloroflexota bacterium]
MSKFLRISFVFALLLALSLGAAGCRSAKPEGEVLVYVTVPLSGFQANAGQTVLGGVRLMADQINSGGGLLGREVKVVALDDESDSDVALAVAEEVKNAIQAGQPVLGVIGHLNSGQTLAAMEVYKDLSLVVVTPTASEVSLTNKGYTNFFRVNANDQVQARVDAEFLVKTLGAKRIAVIHNDTEYGIGLRDQISAELVRLGAVVALTLQVAEGQETYSNEVTAVKQAGVDALFYAGYEIEAPYLRIELVDAGLAQPMLVSDGAFLTTTIDEAEGRAEGMYVSAFAPSPAAVADAQWLKRYREVEYRNPDTYSINGYSSLAVLAEGAEKSKSLDPAKVASALRGIQFETLIGQISYTESGDLKEPRIYVFQVRDGAFVQVQP